MDCYCDDYESPTVYSKVEHAARKVHSCSECRRPIHKGEKYERVFGVWGGDVSVFKTCARCQDLSGYVKAHVPCFCMAHGELIEAAITTAEDYNRVAPGLLFGAYRRLASIRKNKAAQS